MTGNSETKVISDDKLSWKTAISNVWKDNHREYILKSVVVSSIASILRMLQGFVIQGFIIWIALGSVMLILHVSENARLQRKADRERKNQGKMPLNPISSKEGL